MCYTIHRARREGLSRANKNEETIFDKLADITNDLFGLETEENYNNNIAQLGQGELAEKDTDTNGSLSMDDYIKIRDKIIY